MCAIRSKNEKCISARRRDRRRGAARRCSVVRSGRCTRPSRHAPPSSSGVTANGENAVAGFDWKKPNPLASSSGTRLRSVMSLASISRRTCAARLGRASSRAACRRGSPRPRSRSRAPTPDRRAGCRRAGRAARPSRPGRPADRSPASAGGSAPRALRTSRTWFEERRAVDPLVGARQRRTQARRVERLAGTAPASSRAASAASAGAARAQSSSAACSVGAIAAARAYSSGRRARRPSAPRPASRRAASPASCFAV